MLTAFDDAREGLTVSERRPVVRCQRERTTKSSTRTPSVPS